MAEHAWILVHECVRVSCSQGNHIYTSGAIGTNAAVIKGALRANSPDKLTVILPQSLRRQPADSQDLLKQASDPRALDSKNLVVETEVDTPRLGYVWASFGDLEPFTQVPNLVELSENDGLSLADASR